MDEFNKKNRICASCGEVAKSYCGKCTTTWYCSGPCQKKAWPMHKVTCGKTGVDLVVHRTGQLFQDVYLLMRELTFDNSIRSVEDKGDYLLVRDNEMIPGTIFRFPGHLIHNEKQKKMILTTLICQEPTAFLHDFLKEMLSDTNVSLEEHTLRLKKPSKTVRVEAPLETLDLNQYLHSVVVVKSPDKKLSWIVDVSGSQYSIFEACLPEAMYRQRHVTATTAAYKFGTNKAIFETIKYMQGDGPLFARIGWHAAKKISTAISAWKAESDFSLPGLLRQEEGAFVKERKLLMKAIGASLDGFAADVASKFRTDIKETRKYVTNNAWKSQVGLCPFQDVADVTENISQAHRLY